MTVIFFTALSAFFYAFRGGLFSPGNFLGWLTWALWCGVMAFAVTADFITALIVMAGAWSGRYFSHGRYFAITFISDNGKRDWLGSILPPLPEPARNTLAMSIIGFFRAALIALPSLSLIWLPVAAVAHGLIYAAAAYAAKFGLIKSDSQIRAAEFGVGALFGFYVYISLTNSSFML